MKGLRGDKICSGEHEQSHKTGMETWPLNADSKAKEELFLQGVRRYCLGKLSVSATVSKKQKFGVCSVK